MSKTPVEVGDILRRVNDGEVFHYLIIRQGGQRRIICLYAEVSKREIGALYADSEEHIDKRYNREEHLLFNMKDK